MQIAQVISSAAANRKALLKASLPVILLLAAGAASAADPAAPASLDTILDQLTGAVAAGVGTIFQRIAPILVLTFGIAYAWKWVKKV